MWKGANIQEGQVRLALVHISSGLQNSCKETNVGHLCTQAELHILSRFYIAVRVGTNSSGREAPPAHVSVYCFLYVSLLPLNPKPYTTLDNHAGCRSL